MSRKLSAVLGAMVMTAGAVVAAAQPASAAVGSLTLSITPDKTGIPKTVTLTCQPTGGTHPDGEAACTDLAKVSGQISWIPRLPGYYCLSLYDPVTASANGVWNGRPISYSQKFTNSCEANISTGGHVFHF
jgi:hypothetical protein